MKFAPSLFAALAAVCLAGTAQAAIVNINAKVDPSLSSTGSVTTVNLSAGSYKISVFDNTAAGGYNGWTYSTPVPSSNGYRETFSFSVGGSATTYDVSTGGSTGYYTNYSTAAAGLAAFTAAGSAGGKGYARLVNGTYIGTDSSMTLLLASAATVSFFVPDIQGGNPGFSDNGGGVSLNITSAAASVPEPTSIGMALAGCGALALTTRRRRKTV